MSERFDMRVIKNLIRLTVRNKTAIPMRNGQIPKKTNQSFIMMMINYDTSGPIMGGYKEAF